MGDERPSDALQPAAKKRAGIGGRDRDDPDDDDQPSVDPGTWTADATATRERRKVHVRRGAGGSAPVAPSTTQNAASNPFAGIALSFAAPPAAAPVPAAAPEASAAETAPVSAKATEGTAEAKSVDGEAKDVAADTVAAGAAGASGADDGQKPAETGHTEKTDGKDTQAAPAATPQEAKEGTTTSPSGAATPGSSIFGGSAGATSGFASLAAGGAGASTFNFGGFGGGGAAGNIGGGLFGSSGGGIFGNSTPGGGIFGAAATGGTGFGGFSFPKLDTASGSLGKPLFGAAGADAEAGEGGEERPEAFEPSEDPSIKPVVQLAVVQKVTGEEDEQTIYAETGKLFEYDSAASKWRERGGGELRVNVSAAGTSSRMLMRQSGNLRLLLNARITENMRVQRMQGANGVTFGCVNTAAVDPSQPPQSAAATEGSASADKADDKEGAGKPVGGAGLIRTWAFRCKGEDKILALLAALEKAKADHSSAAQQEEKKADAAEDAAV